MNEEFDVHMLNPKGIERAKTIASIFNTALDALVAEIPQGRYLSLVKTKLEEACFFAKKGMAVEKENQNQPDTMLDVILTAAEKVYGKSEDLS